MKGIAVVIGGTHHNTLGVIRSLGDKKIKPFVILIDKSKKRSYVSYSKYINKYWQVSSSDMAVDVLIKHFCGCKNQKVVVFACNDEVALQLDENKKVFPDNYIIPGTTGNIGLNHLMNKQVMAEMAKSVGLTVPKEYDVLDDDIVYPIIAKPLMSVKGQKKDIVVVSNKNELNVYKNNHSLENTQFQQFIDKEIEFQIIGISLNGGEKVIIPGVSTILGYCQSSNTAYLKYGYLNDNYEVEKCVRFMKTVEFNGLFSMEFVRGKDGVNYYMETNYRNDGNAIAVTYAGVNLPYLWFENSVYGQLEEEPFNIKKEVYIMPEMQELFLLKTKKITLGEFVKHLMKTNHFMEFVWKDQLPFWNLIRK